MNKYKMYFLHDPIGNIESQITDFNKDNIKKAIDLGMIIIGITQDNVREVVNSVEDVIEPQAIVTDSFTIVLPSYVDSKVDGLAKIVEELVDALNPLQIKPSILSSIKKSIQQIHKDTLKVIDEDKKMIEASPMIEKKTD